MERFTLETRVVGDTTVVTLSGEVDLAAGDRLWRVFDEHVRRDRTVVAELSGVTFIDSVGLRTLVRALQAAAGVGAVFEIADPSDAVLRVFALGGVTRLFTVTTARADNLPPAAG